MKYIVYQKKKQNRMMKCNYRGKDTVESSVKDRHSFMES